jgi:hypothetical protein
MTFEQGLIRSLNLLALGSHELVMIDMDTFLGSVFLSSEYQKSDEGIENLQRINKIDSFRSEIEKIRNTLVLEHPDKNKFEVSSGHYRSIFKNIQFRNNSVTELESVIEDLETIDVSSESAKTGIRGAYRTCRQAYIVVAEMIDIYNKHNPTNKLPRLRIPQDITD